VCCNVLQCSAVCCSVLQCVAVCPLQRITKRLRPRFIVVVCCNVLQCSAVCCSALQCVAVCCSAVQRVAVRCSVELCGALHFCVSALCKPEHTMKTRCPRLSDAVYCNVAVP